VPEHPVLAAGRVVTHCTVVADGEQRRPVAAASPRLLSGDGVNAVVDDHETARSDSSPDRGPRHPRCEKLPVRHPSRLRPREFHDDPIDVSAKNASLWSFRDPILTFFRHRKTVAPPVSPINSASSPFGDSSRTKG
jgi:hypothetical protein